MDLSTVFEIKWHPGVGPLNTSFSLQVQTLFEECFDSYQVNICLDTCLKIWNKLANWSPIFDEIVYLTFYNLLSKAAHSVDDRRTVNKE